MKHRLEYKLYRRPLAHPLQTARGCLDERRGILIRLTDSTGAVGYGEVAPLDGFGTETVEEAMKYLEGMGGFCPVYGYSRVSARYPCLQMAMWMAEEMLQGPEGEKRTLTVAALLPAGYAALDSLSKYREKGYRVFKWKISVLPVTEEQRLFPRLLEMLPGTGSIRLDANGGLSSEAFESWLRLLREAPQVAYLEQPRPPGELDAMMRLSRKYGVRLALDESISQVDSLLLALISGWNGVPVIKPSILGSPIQYLQWQATWQRKLVFSSAFETGIGLEGALRMAAHVTDAARVEALGFGVRGFFPEDGLSPHLEGPEITSGIVGKEEMEDIWERATG